MEAIGSRGTETKSDSDEIQSVGSRWNFAVLVAVNVMVRVGWIFKTESIIMPAILDAIGGGGWLRGCLPMLNRMGQSVIPMLAADRIRQARRQKHVVAASAGSMGLCFLVLAGMWIFLDGRSPGWLPWFFLLAYGTFWLCVGLHNLSVSLLYGKLIAAIVRGRLMLVATMLGAVVAIACAWFLMRPWLAASVPQFTGLFIGAGVSFLTAAILVMQLDERPDSKRADARTTKQLLVASFDIFRTDANFRRLGWIAAAFGMSITMFPHYQAYGREQLQLGLGSLVPWVIAQNLGSAIFSLPTGAIADRYGNRLAIKASMLMLCGTPVLMMATRFVPIAYQPMSSCAVFFLLGLTPISMRTFSNYTLEIADRGRQPIYLSTLGLCLALPVILLSTAVGALVDLIGFEPLFVLITAILLIGWSLSFGLREPRHRDLSNQPANRQTIGLE